jgi:hypothetical protein
MIAEWQQLYGFMVGVLLAYIAFSHPKRSKKAIVIVGFSKNNVPKTREF